MPKSRGRHRSKAEKGYDKACTLMLPLDLKRLIMSFLPVPEPYVQQTHYFQLDYMRTENWSDVTDVRAYGDY